jgi:dihydrofolate synthase/folylpolyglutamate synthase
MDKLGNRLCQIAREKAGIIKKNIPVLSLAQRPAVMRVLKRRAREMRAPLRLLGKDILLKSDGGFPQRIDISTPSRNFRRIRLNLFGKHQAENLALAVGGCELLGVDLQEDTLRDAIAKLKIPGRIEMIWKRPKLIVDCAHNLVSMQALREVLQKEISFERLILVFGAMEDKDIRGMLKELLPISWLAIFTEPKNPRSCSAEKLLSLGRRFKKFPMLSLKDPKQAFMEAKRIARGKDLILVTGSFYLAGEILSIVYGGPKTPEI